MENADDAITEEQRAMALAYLKGEMQEPERGDFEIALAESEILREELSQSRAIMDTLASVGLPDVATFVVRTFATAILASASDLHILPQRSLCSGACPSRWLTSAAIYVSQESAGKLH